MSTAIEAATGVQQTQRALKCFLALQSKLPKDSNLWDQYNDISQRLFAEIGALQMGEQMGEKRARPETSPGNDTHKIEGATQKKRHRRNDGSPASA